MAFIRGNERESLARSHPTGWRWPGNIPAGVTPAQLALDIQFETVDQPYGDPQAVLRSPPIVAAVVESERALGQLIVRESAPSERAQQSFSRHFVPPDVKFTAFGNAVFVPQELSRDARRALDAILNPGLKDALLSAKGVILARESPDTERRRIDPVLRWNKPDDLRSARQSAIVERESPATERRAIEALLRWGLPQDLLSYGKQAILARESPDTERRGIDPFIRWAIPPNFIEPPLLGNQVIREREVTTQERRAIDPVIKFRIPENVIFTAYGNAWVNGREVSPQEQHAIDALLRWGQPTDAAVGQMPADNRIISPAERWAYDFVVLAPYANSVAGPGPVQEPPPFGRIFSRQEFREPWVLNLGGLVSLEIPAFKPLIIGREQRLFENIQAILRWGQPAEFVAPPLSFGNRVITLRELSPQELHVLDALLQSGRPPEPLFTAFGNRVITLRELNPRQIDAIMAIVGSGIIPQDVIQAILHRQYNVQIAHNMARIRRHRR